MQIRSVLWIEFLRFEKSDVSTKVHGLFPDQEIPMDKSPPLEKSKNCILLNESYELVMDL